MTDTGSPLPTENKAASDADSIISGSVQAGERALEKAAETAEPVLAAPIIKQIFEGFVNWLLGLASRAGQILVTFGITREQGNLENSSLVAAEKEVETAIQSGDAHAIEKAEQDFQRAQSGAVNSDGSAQPK